MSNLKQRCVVCKKEVVYFRMVLMMGPKGFRRYQCCDKCAEKAEKNQKAERGMQKAGA